MIFKNQAEIDHLITCPKVFLNPPSPKMIQKSGSLRNEARLRSKDGRKHFRVFIRQSVRRKF